MKAVLTGIVPEFVAWRKRTGTDKFDEMWEGVWHMCRPSLSHQDILADIHAWLRSHWARPRGNRVSCQVNLAPPGGWPKNFRIPDLVLLTPDRFDINRDAYLEGAPTVVVEIRSPGDETMEKLPFYAQLGVPEVWVVDRTAKLPELRIELRIGPVSTAAAGGGRLVPTAPQRASNCGRSGQPAGPAESAGDDATRRVPCPSAVLTAGGTMPYHSGFRLVLDRPECEMV